MTAKKVWGAAQLISGVSVIAYAPHMAGEWFQIMVAGAGGVVVGLAIADLS